MRKRSREVWSVLVFTEKIMSRLDTYTFILCMIILVCMTAVFTALICNVCKQTVRLIAHGAEDKRIITEYKKSLKKQKTRGGWIANVFVGVVFFVIFSVFAFSVVAGISEKSNFQKIPSMRVVRTASMEKKHAQNTYLKKNNLNNQIYAFDLILTYKLPKEEDLKLYDIVVYDVDGTLLVHRIVRIEEPNKDHPNERWFTLQGDGVETPDRFPVHYSQMRAIYKNQRVPLVGSFVLFLQSPAGYICIGLVILEMIGTAFLEKKISKADKARLALLLKNQKNPKTAQVAQKKPTTTNVPTKQSPYIPAPNPLPPVQGYILGYALVPNVDKQETKK